MLNGRIRTLLLCGLTCTLVACTGSEPAPPARQTGTDPAPGAAGAGDPYYPADGNGGYDALGYEVSVRYEPAANRLRGDTVLTATATKDLSRFNLDLRGFEVESVRVNGRPAEFRREGEFELVISPARALAEAETFQARIRYGGAPRAAGEGQLGANGWQRTGTGEAFVLGQPHSAAYWYPVNETPRDKATFRLEATVPEGWTAVSIGREIGARTADGWTTTTWEERTPVASYLTTLAIGRFTLERRDLADGTPVLDAYAPGAEEQRDLGRRTGEVIGFLAGKFGPYPQRAAGGIYLDERIGFSLETQGRPVYAEWADLETVVHELAHQWYGNSVSVRSWSDICLNECLASYAQWLWLEEQRGEDLDARFHRIVERTRNDDEFWSPKLHEMGAGNEFEGVYDKGPLAIHALRRKIGEEAFARVLPEWAAEHREGNASWPEFERFVTEISGQELDAFFAAWFRGTGIPRRARLFPGSLGG
ncbi:M1 family metallopeptidase [Amycolatopsis cihanbeyliensis]|uniref:Aminopeptidase N n=1 Tax=Amycolatopsis cihanbeyliensis TaxID=1128664 RepID=A0A542DNI9_AMYCI|nr:M1 family metallopeptidase [Amycolatopsis cihanbeyliensis]TQJ04534.1 peptidase M1-like protein [Amycolatopsis cihanbeyliensis]